MAQQYMRQVPDIILPNTGKFTRQNQIFKSFQKWVCFGIRYRIGDIILYVYILHMYNLVHKILVNFSITGINFLGHTTKKHQGTEPSENISVWEKNCCHTLSILLFIIVIVLFWQRHHHRSHQKWQKTE